MHLNALNLGGLTLAAISIAAFGCSTNTIIIHADPKRSTVADPTFGDYATIEIYGDREILVPASTDPRWSDLFFDYIIEVPGKNVGELLGTPTAPGSLGVIVERTGDRAVIQRLVHPANYVQGLVAGMKRDFLEVKDNEAAISRAIAALGGDGKLDARKEVLAGRLGGEISKQATARTNFDNALVDLNTSSVRERLQKDFPNTLKLIDKLTSAQRELRTAEKALAAAREKEAQAEQQKKFEAEVADVKKRVSDLIAAVDGTATMVTALSDSQGALVEAMKQLPDGVDAASVDPASKKLEDAVKAVTALAQHLSTAKDLSSAKSQLESAKAAIDSGTLKSAVGSIQKAIGRLGAVTQDASSAKIAYDEAGLVSELQKLLKTLESSSTAPAQSIATVKDWLAKAQTQSESVDSLIGSAAHLSKDAEELKESVQSAIKIKPATNSPGGANSTSNASSSQPAESNAGRSGDAKSGNARTPAGRSGGGEGGTRTDGGGEARKETGSDAGATTPDTDTEPEEDAEDEQGETADPVSPQSEVEVAKTAVEEKRKALRDVRAEVRDHFAKQSADLIQGIPEHAKKIEKATRTALVLVSSDARVAALEREIEFASLAKDLRSAQADEATKIKARILELIDPSDLETRKLGFADDADTGKNPGYQNPNAILVRILARDLRETVGESFRIRVTLDGKEPNPSSAASDFRVGVQQGIIKTKAWVVPEAQTAQLFGHAFAANFFAVRIELENPGEFPIVVYGDSIEPTVTFGFTNRVRAAELRQFMVEQGDRWDFHPYAESLNVLALRRLGGADPAAYQELEKSLIEIEKAENRLQDKLKVLRIAEEDYHACANAYLFGQLARPEGYRGRGWNDRIGVDRGSDGSPTNALTRARGNRGEISALRVGSESDAEELEKARAEKSKFAAIVRKRLTAVIAAEADLEKSRQVWERCVDGILLYGRIPKEGESLSAMRASALANARGFDREEVFVVHQVQSQYQMWTIDDVLRSLQGIEQERPLTWIGKTLRYVGALVTGATVFNSDPATLRGIAYFTGVFIPGTEEMLKTDVATHLANLQERAFRQIEEIPRGESITRFGFIPRGQLEGLFGDDRLSPIRSLAWDERDSNRIWIDRDSTVPDRLKVQIQEIHSEQPVAVRGKVVFVDGALGSQPSGAASPGKGSKSPAGAEPAGASGGGTK